MCVFYTRLGGTDTSSVTLTTTEESAGDVSSRTRTAHVSNESDEYAQS